MDGRFVSYFFCIFEQRKRRNMCNLVQFAADFLKREDGPTAVEYAVMLALIVVVCITAITTLGGNANQVFSNVALNTAVGTTGS
jgi:pilus assembly protein Flp/PilA